MLNKKRKMHFGLCLLKSTCHCYITAKFIRPASILRIALRVISSTLRRAKFITINSDPRATIPFDSRRTRLRREACSAEDV